MEPLIRWRDSTHHNKPSEWERRRRRNKSRRGRNGTSKKRMMMRRYTRLNTRRVQKCMYTWRIMKLLSQYCNSVDKVLEYERVFSASLHQSIKLAVNK